MKKEEDMRVTQLAREFEENYGHKVPAHRVNKYYDTKYPDTHGSRKIKEGRNYFQFLFFLDGIFPTASPDEIIEIKKSLLENKNKNWKNKLNEMYQLTEEMRESATRSLIYWDKFEGLLKSIADNKEIDNSPEYKTLAFFIFEGKAPRKNTKSKTTLDSYMQAFHLILNDQYREALIVVESGKRKDKNSKVLKLFSRFLKKNIHESENVQKMLSDNA